MIHDLLLAVFAFFAVLRFWHVIALILHVACAVATFVVMGSKGYRVKARGWLLSLYVALHGVFGLITAALLPTRGAA